MANQGTKPKKKKRKKKRHGIYVLIVLLFLLLATFFLFLFYMVKNGKISFGGGQKNPLWAEMVNDRQFVGLRGVETERLAEVTRFGTYGTHLQWEGTFEPAEGKEVKGLSLCFQEALGEDPEGSFEAIFKKPLSGTDEFETAASLNEGIVMDLLPEGEAVMALRVTYTDDTREFLSFTDVSEMTPIDYYTLTDEGKNRHITITFMHDQDIDYALYSCEEAPLPSEVYDIVIDPGHGGRDTGAVVKDITERDQTLAYAKDLKDLLEEKGYKVFLTRDGSEDRHADMAYMMYDEDGRVNTTCRSKAKIALSIHFNSVGDSSVSGLEVYCTTRGNIDLAKELADSIVEGTGSPYSAKKSMRRASGVYSRAYTAEEIRKEEGEPDEDGYDRTTETDYYFMIREPGELWTGAFVDGRGTKYGENLFRDENAGVESILMELGYLTNASDLERIVTHREAYVEAIRDAVVSWHDNLLGRTEE